MGYGLYLGADQDRWWRDDFSSDDKLTGTIYTDVNQVTAKDLTGYTVTVRLSRLSGPGRIGAMFEKEADIVVAANGTWSYAVQEGDLPPRGLYKMSVQLTKSGTQETTLNRVEFYILEGPA